MKKQINKTYEDPEFHKDNQICECGHIHLDDKGCFNYVGRGEVCYCKKFKPIHSPQKKSAPTGLNETSGKYSEDTPLKLKEKVICMKHNYRDKTKCDFVYPEEDVAETISNILKMFDDETMYKGKKIKQYIKSKTGELK